MRSGSCAWRASLTLVVASALAVAVSGWAENGSVRSRAEHVGGGAHSALLSLRETSVAPSIRRLGEAKLAWRGGRAATSTGEQLTVYVSDSYSPEQVSPQAWADFFGSLLHGPEISLLTVYIATPAEIQSMCGSEYALGCYGGNELALIGEPVDGLDPHEVARHEYGHHVAAHRENTPWLAIDWGTKRWASQENICSRVSAGTAYPADEDEHYMLNPGEAFAETYRVLNDLKAGVTGFPWSIVDGSFYPSQAALDAVELDVTQPWAAPDSRTLRRQFRPKGAKQWTLRLETPLDGILSVRLLLPKGRLYDLTALTPDGTVLAKGLWSGAAEKTLSFTVCGQRTVLLRVTRSGAPGRFTLQEAQP